jgi:ABC-type phosphate/phosphonate transport system permease subunit
LEAGFLLLPLVSLLAAVSLLLRFRGAIGEARQQLKWFAAGAAVAAIGVLASVPIGFAGSDQLANAVVLGGIACLPVATGVAILRYRLYDIDRLINRTLVYGLLTAALGLGYAAGSLVFVLVAGAGPDPPS